MLALSLTAFDPQRTSASALQIKVVGSPAALPHACRCVGLDCSVQFVTTPETTTFGVKPLPFDCHSVKVPVEVLRHNRSLVPSPVPASVQPGATEPTKLFGVNPLPVESQMVRCRCRR
jgi:hypothetical protein